MQEIATVLKSPAWWLTTVVLAILINIVSSYLKNGADRLVARYSDRRAAALGRRAEARAHRIAVYSTDQDAWIRGHFNVIRSRVRASQFLILGFVTLALATILVGIIEGNTEELAAKDAVQLGILVFLGLLSFLWGIMDIRTSDSEWRELLDAKWERLPTPASGSANSPPS